MIRLWLKYYKDDNIRKISVNIYQVFTIYAGIVLTLQAILCIYNLMVVFIIILLHFIDKLGESRAGVSA